MKRRGSEGAKSSEGYSKKAKLQGASLIQPGAEAPRDDTFDYKATELTASEWQAFARPSLDPSSINTSTNDLYFQITDCRASYASPGRDVAHDLVQLDGYGQVPVVRMYGVLPTGQSIVVNVWNFYPYLYIKAPVDSHGHQVETDVAYRLRRALEGMIKKEQARRRHTRFSEITETPVAAEKATDARPEDDGRDFFSRYRYGGVGAWGGLDRFGEVESDDDEEGDEEGRPPRQRPPAVFPPALAASTAPPPSSSQDASRQDASLQELLRQLANEPGGESDEEEDDDDEEEDKDPAGDRIVALTPMMKKTVEHFQGQPQRVYKVELRTPNMITMVRDTIGDGNSPHPMARKIGANLFVAGPTYESGIRFENRFMLDRGIVGSGWVSLRAGQYRVTSTGRRRTRCTLELDVVAPHDVQGHGVKDRPDLYDQLPCRMRRLDYDIECMGRDGAFPLPERDPVINIHAWGYDLSEEETPILDMALVLGSSLAVGQAGKTRTINFRTERELLEYWARLQQVFDPDIISGYNSSNFDNKYVCERALTIGATACADTSRLCGFLVQGRIERRQSRNFGNTERYSLQSEGRVYFDMLTYVTTNLFEKQRSYTLNAVAAAILKDQKDDVAHTQIPILHAGSREDRKRLADYCRKDALLVGRLCSKLMALVATFEQTRVQRVQLDQQQNGGASFKVFAQLIFEFNKAGYIVPYRRNLVKHDYKGATVFEPERGYYGDEPVGVEDFGSLYPSLDIAHNLCMTTYVPNDEVKMNALAAFNLLDPWTHGDAVERGRIENDVFYTCPVGHCYIREKYQKGIFPLMLADLLSLRKQAQALMKAEQDILKKKVYNQRQDSLKRSANSGYGFHGLVSNGVYWHQVAESITASGRDQIMLTKRLIEEKFTTSNGYPGNARVIYGDTDSVMVLWGLKMKNPDDAEERRASLSRAIQLSQEAAKYCEAHFAKPNTLNFENLYFPFLLITKKRYGGQMWQTADAPVPKLKIQGLESKRRDNCKLVSRTQERCLELILRERCPDDALAFTQRQIQELLTGRVDMHDLIITKQLRCYQKDYKSPQPHAHVRELMEKRSPGSGAKIGDRVPYVFIRRERKEVMYLSAEDPLYAVEHDLPINTNYYLQNQFFKPMVRIFSPVYGESEAVTLVQHGEHTRHLDFHVTLHSDQGLGRYFTKRIMCRGCKVTLTESNVSPHAKVEHRLCSSCEPRRIEYYTADMEDLRTTERESGLCWANCQNCQGSRFQAVICSAQDCPVFYKRLVLRRDVVVKGKQLALLGLEDS